MNYRDMRELTMPALPALPRLLLEDTAACVGQDYLQQLVNSLARHSGAALAFISQPLAQAHGQAQILYASKPLTLTHYALAATPCALLQQTRQPLLGERAVYPLGDTVPPGHWPEFAGWPLQPGDEAPVGQLILLSEHAGMLPASLLADVAPFARRAAAELLRLHAERLRQRRSSWDALHSHFLRQYMQGQPLHKLLHEVVRQIESNLPGWLCSIVQIDAEQRLRPLAGPSLPLAYSQLIDGLAIGPSVGSCGAAAWHRKRLIAENLQQHPNWAAYREIARRFDLGSCWSEPIIDSQGKVHGTFAVYHHAPSAPTPDAITVIEDTARLLAVLMENDANQRALDSRTQWYQAILQNAADALSIIDMDGRILEASDSLCQLLGYTQAEIRQLRLWDLVAHRDEATLRQELQRTSSEVETFDSVNRHKQGELIEVEVSVRRLLLDGQPVVWGSARDVRERKKQERLLREQATLDSLTGLYNRHTLLAQLEAQLPHWPVLTLLMIDLDHFKQINDHYGHACGDAALAHFASQLRQLLNDGEYAGRIGGEEFCVLLPGCHSDSAAWRARQLQQTMQANPLYFAGQHIALTASAGLSMALPSDDSRSLLARADMALYEAKHRGRNRIVAQPAP